MFIIKDKSSVWRFAAVWPAGVMQVGANYLFALGLFYMLGWVEKAV